MSCFFVDYIIYSKNLRNELLNRREVNTSQNTGKVKRYRPGMVYLVVLISKQLGSRIYSEKGKGGERTSREGKPKGSGNQSGR